MTNRPNGTLYVGVTSDLRRRVFDHKAGNTGGFTSKCELHRLVYAERHENIVGAIQREKNIKHWSREWKIDLIVAGNPDWRDLYEEIVR